MATKTFEELKQLAIQIRDEKTNKQNTATRIGTQMLEHLNKLEQDYYDKTATDEELKQRDEKLTELSSNVGLYNVDKGVPLDSGFYTSTTARTAVPISVRKLGLIITYKTDATTSITEQFIGSSISVWSTDVNWKIVGSDGGNKILEWETDAATTRKKVITKDRKAGMIISYTSDGINWINEQFIGKVVSNDDVWAADKNWVSLQNSNDFKFLKDFSQQIVSDKHINGQIIYPTVDNFTLYNNFVFNLNTSYKHSRLYVAQGGSYKINCSFNTNVYSIIEYDKFAKIVNVIQLATGTNEHTFSVNENTLFVDINYYNSEITVEVISGGHLSIYKTDDKKVYLPGYDFSNTLGVRDGNGSFITDKGYLNNNGTVSSNIVLGMCVTDYLWIPDGVTLHYKCYVYNSNMYHVRFDKNKDYIEAITNSGTGNNFESSGEIKGGCYVRFSFRENLGLNLWAENILPYTLTFSPSEERDTNSDIKVIERSIPAVFKDIDMAEIFEFSNKDSKNVHNNQSMIYGGIINTSAPNFMVTNFIEIGIGTFQLTYDSVLNLAVCLFDRFKKFVTGWDLNVNPLEGWSNKGGTFSITDENIRYIRISCYNSATIRLYPNESYSFKRDDRANFNYYGKKLVTIGDSNTQQKQWQDYLCTITGMVWSKDETNTGVGSHYELTEGERLDEYQDGATEVKNAPMGLAGTGIRSVYTTEQDISNPTWVNGNERCSINERAKDARYYNPDVIILWPCANDFSAVQNTQLCGTINDEPYTDYNKKVEYMSQPVDGVTVYSCLKGTLQVLSETNPNARIVCLSLAPWYIYEKGNYEEYMKYEKDVNNVIKDCCKEYNIQYIDLFSGLGWNFWNANQYYTKSSGTEEGSDVSNRQVHPNDNGQMSIAQFLSNYFL